MNPFNFIAIGWKKNLKGVFGKGVEGNWFDENVKWKLGTNTKINSLEDRWRGLSSSPVSYCNMLAASVLCHYNDKMPLYNNSLYEYYSVFIIQILKLLI